LTEKLIAEAFGQAFLTPLEDLAKAFKLGINHLDRPQKHLQMLLEANPREDLDSVHGILAAPSKEVIAQVPGLTSFQHLLRSPTPKDVSLCSLDLPAGAEAVETEIQKCAQRINPLHHK